MRYAIFLLILLIISFELFSQNIITGRVSDVNGKSLENVNILLYSSDKDIILSYCTTDLDGRFVLKVESSKDTLFLVTSSIQYRKETKKILNQTQEVSFFLEIDIKQLEDFVVKAEPISRHGDTLSFLVSSFNDQNDKVIDDILRKIPGIEVEPNGRILYQGMAISKFYVEGMDLMDGKYGIISKNLPYNSVSTIEVFENHQPISVLRDRSYTPQAAINLKLKTKQITTGIGKVGIGYAPALWEANLTPITLRPDLQILTSLQTNNTGIELANQLLSHNNSETLLNLDNNMEDGLLALSFDNSTLFNDKSKKFNETYLLNSNLLTANNNGTQFRIGVSYLNDKNWNFRSLSNTFFLAHDTIALQEKVESRFHYKNFTTTISAEKNTKNVYFNNGLNIKSVCNNEDENININGDEILQMYTKPSLSINNDLTVILPYNNRLVSLSSVFRYSKLSENLNVSPGQFKNLINDSLTFSANKQVVYLDRIFTNNTIGVSYNWGNFYFSPRLGFLYSKQFSNSELFKTNKDSTISAGESYINKIDANKIELNILNEFQYIARNFTIEANLPVSFQNSILDSQRVVERKSLSRIFFNPRISFSYEISNFWKLHASFATTNNIVGTNDFYDGYILRNYRTLGKNELPILISKKTQGSILLSYRNVFTSFSQSLSYTLTQNHDNYSLSSALDANGTFVTNAIEYPNQSVSHFLKIRLSKFYPTIRSTISCNISGVSLSRLSFVNSAKMKTKNLILIISPEVLLNVTRWLKTEYLFKAEIQKNKNNYNTENNFGLFSHQLKVFGFPFDNHLFSLSNKYNRFNGNVYYVADFFYRYSIPRKRIELEFRWDNIFNNYGVYSFYYSSYSYYELFERLRPSKVVLGVKFSF
ncbi:MAG: hypothetical protein FD155_1758 [Bacteroidetes bacterium]|nr:MAG: hypothetical protein FD155_1758 [Bacteroidota bacterium]